MLVKYEKEKYSVYSGPYTCQLLMLLFKILVAETGTILALLVGGSSEREDCQDTTVRSAGSRVRVFYVLRTVAGQLGGGGGGEGGEYITTILIWEKGQGGQRVVTS